MVPTEPFPGRDANRGDFGRDGISGLVTPDRALRAREVSRPTPDDLAEAERRADELIARLDQQPVRRRRR